MKTFKMKPRYIIVIASLLLLTSSIHAQTSDYKAMCFEYHKFNCNYSDNLYYRYNDASRSALFLKGQTSETRLEIYNGRDYRISLCADEVLGRQIY